MNDEVILPPRLKPGDRVRFVSPASPVKAGILNRTVALLESMGLAVEFGDHIYNVDGTLDYLAGSDEERLVDINEALRDPGVKAVIATRGGKGAYRIANRMDFNAMRKNPKLLVGFSETTILHMAMLKECNIAGIHGAAWHEGFGTRTMESFVKAVTSADDIVIKSTADEHTCALTTSGRVEGRLIGGNQNSIATALGWGLPSFDNAILLLEAFNLRLGHIDRELTVLINSGILKNIAGVAIGQYTQCGSATDPTTDCKCTEIDVLRDRLALLNVPIIGGLPIGHGNNPIALPIGTHASLGADNGTLRIKAGVR